MSHIQTLLSRLDGVKPAGPDRWRSYCPSHQLPPHRAGRGRSLTVAAGDNGGALIHCHAGCSSSEVVASLGLELADLFPPRLPGTHAARGNGGPAAWAGAAGAADALGDAVIELMVGSASIFDVLARVEGFKRAARIAMRADASRAKGAA